MIEKYYYLILNLHMFYFKLSSLIFKYIDENKLKLNNVILELIFGLSHSNISV